MSIFHTDGFDYYTNNTQNATIYRPGAFTNNNPTGAFSYGRAADLRGEGSYTYDHANKSTIIVGAHLNFNGNVSNNSKFLIFYDGTTQQISFTVSADSRINVYRGATLLGTTVDPIVTNAWLWFSIKVVFHGSTGSVSIKINEHEVLSLTNIDTTSSANNYCTATGLGTSLSSSATFWDNLYMLDDTGATYNDHILEHRIKTLYPTADGSETGFTASAGNKWACLDENTPNDSTDSVSSNTVNHVYTMGTQSSGINGSVSHVKLSVWAYKDDAGSREVAMVNKISGTVYVGTGIPVTPGWRYHSQTFLTNPATSGVWNKTSVEATKFGFKLVT
jgi:hypothetical protein